MRILQLNSARKYVGEAAHTLNLTEALRRNGHSVWLGLRTGFPTMARAVERGLEPFGLRMHHGWWPPRELHDMRRIAGVVREHGIQLIHAHRGKDHWQALLAVKLFGLRVPVLRTRHVVTPLSANPANRWLANRTAGLVAVSQAVRQDVERTRLYTGKLHFIPGGIDLKLFSPATVAERLAMRGNLELPPDAPLAICVARFADVKAHPVLLQAWREVHQALPNARLALVGGGRAQPQLEELARQLELGSSVLFLGTRKDIPELLDAADLGVLSSIGSEGFSRAVLEYMAKGLPTVATRVGAVPDLIEEGLSGMLVPPGNSGILAETLRRALECAPAQRQAWGRAARAAAERKYGYATWAQAHEDLYGTLLAGR